MYVSVCMYVVCTYLKVLHVQTKYIYCCKSEFTLDCQASKTSFGCPSLSKNDWVVERTTCLSNLPHDSAVILRCSREVTLIPVVSRALTWSIIRLTVGSRTTVIFAVIVLGNWKQRLFPEPVGCTMSAFLPPRLALITRSYQSLKAFFFKNFHQQPRQLGILMFYGEISAGLVVVTCTSTAKGLF